MLDLVSTFQSLLLTFALVVGPGYVVGAIGRETWKGFLPISLRIIVYLALGLGLMTLLITLIGFLVIDGRILVLVGGAGLAVAIVDLLRRRETILRELKTRESWRANLPPLVLFGLSFTYFAYIVGSYSWPPAGDAMEHGLITSLIRDNGRIFLDYRPLDARVPIVLPIGFQAVAANVSLVFGLFPGEAVFVTGALIVMLVPLIAYSIVWVITRSLIASLIGSVGTLLINSISGLESWLIGYFFNGPYPVIFAYLIMSLIFLQLALLDAQKTTSIRSFDTLPTFCFLTVLLVFVYPNFAIFPLAFLAYLLVVEGVRRLRGQGAPRLFFLAPLLLIIFLIVGIIAAYITGFIETIIVALSKVYGRSSYTIRPSFWYDNLSGWGIILAGGLSLFFIVKKKIRLLAAWYLSLFGILLLAGVGPLYDPISIILPRRAYALLLILSWSIIGYALFTFILSRVSQPEKASRTSGLAERPRLKRHHALLAIKVISVIGILALVSPSIASHALLEQADKYDWFSRSTYFQNDYEILEWISQNIPAESLILNDFSFTSTFLLSFAPQRVTDWFHLATDYEFDRAREVQSFWENPRDTVHFQILVEKYAIDYVLITTEWGYRDWVGIGGDNSYRAKPLERVEYKSIMDNHPFLIPRFTKGLGGIYEVVDLDSASSDIMELADEDQADRWIANESGQGSVGIVAGPTDDYSLPFSGESSLLIRIGPGSSTSVEIRFPLADFSDFTMWEFVAFYWFGRGRGFRMELSLVGPSPLDHNLYSIVETWQGWRRVVFPLALPAAVAGTPNLSNLTYVQLTLVDPEPGSFNLDLLHLIRRR